jgi:hypothetical protein
MNDHRGNALLRLGIDKAECFRRPRRRQFIKGPDGVLLSFGWPGSARQRGIERCGFAGLGLRNRVFSIRQPQSKSGSANNNGKNYRKERLELETRAWRCRADSRDTRHLRSDFPLRLRWWSLRYSSWCHGVCGLRMDSWRLARHSSNSSKRARSSADSGPSPESSVTVRSPCSLSHLRVRESGSSF